MARTAITPTTIVRTGDVDAGTAGIADGHKFTNTGRTFLRVVNGNAGATRDITVQTPRTVDGLAVAELVVTVGTSATVLMGPFPTATFNRTTGADAGSIYMDYEATESDLTVEVYDLPL